MSRRSSLTGGGGGGGGAAQGLTPAIVVGNSVVGDVLGTDCDFLDVGDGVQLQAALATAGANLDVWVRPGTYDLGAGAATSPLVVPNSTTLRGAGTQQTFIRTKSTGNMGALGLNSEATVMDVGIEVARPTAGPPAGATAVITMANATRCIRVQVEFIGALGWDATDVGETALRSVYDFSCPNSPAYLMNCTSNTATSRQAPSFDTLVPGTDFIMVTATGPNSQVIIVDCELRGGDIGVSVVQTGLLIRGTIFRNLREGVRAQTTQNRFGLFNSDINVQQNLATMRGVVLNNIDFAIIQGNYIQGEGGIGVGLEAVELVNGCVGCSINGNFISDWDRAIKFSAAGDDDNVATGNVFNTITQAAPVEDLGAGNDVAHNIDR